MGNPPTISRRQESVQSLPSPPDRRRPSTPSTTTAVFTDTLVVTATTQVTRGAGVPSVYVTGVGSRRSILGGGPGLGGTRPVTGGDDTPPKSVLHPDPGTKHPGPALHPRHGWSPWVSRHVSGVGGTLRGHGVPSETGPGGPRYRVPRWGVDPLTTRTVRFVVPSGVR